MFKLLALEMYNVLHNDFVNWIHFKYFKDLFRGFNLKDQCFELPAILICLWMTMQKKIEI